jgi:uncharacterized protein YciI
MGVVEVKFFFCKFYPPRKDFLSTMTPTEAQLMKEHGAYLQGLVEKEKVVAHGPVQDPAGGFGLSLFRIEDGEDINAFTAGDPMILAAIGARYDVYPMLQLRTRS